MLRTHTETIGSSPVHAVEHQFMIGRFLACSQRISCHLAIDEVEESDEVVCEMPIVPFMARKEQRHHITLTECRNEAQLRRGDFCCH